ncbi:uncharacterized protein LOC126293500 [Schistocerca gregaria]|uniref:uncharacterized protein LOC126293500 n=1 Tax=Schistocerca gregaria TaxID=7010 RepID=UPI00211EB24B|nr:uncharacterized protein LOC126293500 [Schistocerca gregaria]
MKQKINSIRYQALPCHLTFISCRTNDSNLYVGATVNRKQDPSFRKVNEVKMPDVTNTSYYSYAKFSNISETSLKNVTLKDTPYCDESLPGVVSQLQGTASLPSLNLNTSETETQDELILPQCETHQKEFYHQQLQNSCTFCADSSSHTCCPEQTVICGKPDVKNQIWQDSKYVAQLLEQVKPFSQVENYAAGEPTDGISTSKSSSSCKMSDICHSNTYSNHSQKNSRDPSYEEASSSNTKWQNGGNKAQEKNAQLLEPHGKHPTGNSICSAEKYVQCKNENLRQQNKMFNSECLHGCVSPITGSNKQLTVKPGSSVSKSPHKVGCKVMPHQNSKQNSMQSAKTEVGNEASYQGDTSKYDDTARLEIFKLRNRIKRYTEGLDSPILRKSHTFHAQKPDSPSAKILKSKTQPVPECRKDNQSLSHSKSQFQYTKHSSLIQKSALQMSHVASVKKKRKSSETCDRLLGTQREMGSRTMPSDASSTVSDCQSRESSSDKSNRREPYERNWDMQNPTHLSTERNVYQKKSGSAKSVPQHALVKNKVDTAEHCTKQYQGNCPQQTKTVKRNQLRRPVPGQKPLYNYDQLSYQASEVYPDLICELEEKLSAINSEHADCKSVSPRSKQRLKNK